MTHDARALSIWVLQIGEPLPIRTVREMRTALLCQRLAARGHSVLWWASAFDHFTKEWLFDRDTRVPVARSLEIMALRGCGYSSNVSLRRFIDHRLIARRFRKLAPNETPPDLIVASLPSHDLAYEAAVYAAPRGIPLVVDVRDKWPDWIVEHLPRAAQGIARLILTRDFGMVRFQLSRAASLTSMMDSMLHWAQDRGAPRDTGADRVFYLGARRLQPPAGAPGKKLAFLATLGDKEIVSFVGTFGSYYHPGILVEAARRMKGERVHFVLGGSGDFFEDVRSSSAGLDNVTLTGWLDEPEIAWLMSRTALGVIPCTVMTDAFPNKAFTYLAGGVPVISSLQGDLKHLLEHESIGRYYPPNDVGALVEAIRALLREPLARREMAGNVMRFFDQALDANVIYDQFARHLEHVASSRDGVDATDRAKVAS